MTMVIQYGPDYLLHFLFKMLQRSRSKILTLDYFEVANYIKRWMVVESFLLPEKQWL